MVLGENAFPEFLQEDCTADKLAAALAQIIDETPARAAQCDALSRLSGKMELPEGSPSEKAAAIVLQYARQAQAAPHTVG
jgi:lipid-A-disaccharide synthase